MVPVQSSNISAVGYDENSMTLVVQFSNGGIYSYDAVPQILYNELLASPSKGSFFANNIKKSYTAKRV